jgi:hypothetical protein
MIWARFVPISSSRLRPSMREQDPLTSLITPSELVSNTASAMDSSTEFFISSATVRSRIRPATSSSGVTTASSSSANAPDMGDSAFRIQRTGRPGTGTHISETVDLMPCL